MEEVSILILSMFFIIIYLFCILCVYIDILMYVVFHLLMDASMPSPNTDAEVEVACSLGAPYIDV
jgi:hypothetical protein